MNQAGAIGAIGALIMAGYKLKENTNSAFYPAILTIVSLLIIWAISANFNLSIKTITETSDWWGVFFVSIAVLGLLTGIFWSAWRAFVTEDTLRDVMAETAKTTSLVFIILLGAAMLTAAFRGFGGEEVVKHFLSSLPGGFWSQFIVVMLVIFLLGFFLDFIEIAVVVVPIVAPILLADPSANVTAVWLGVMIGLNIQTSFLTPPFGFALFYLRGVASKAVKTIEMYKGVIPFIALQLVGLAIVGFNPTLVNYLPTTTFLSSETAPPPKNPRLQLCVEDYLFNFYDTQKDEYLTSLDGLKKVNLSVLPDKKQQQLRKNIQNAADVFERVDEIKKAKAAISDASLAYAPVHGEVRMIERHVRQLEIEKVKLEKSIRSVDDPERKTDIEEDIGQLKSQIEQKLGLIPADWKQTNSEFKKLTAQLNRARMQFRRGSDQTYAEIKKLASTIESHEELTLVGTELSQIQASMSGAPVDQTLESLKSIYSKLTKIPDTEKINKTLSKSRKIIEKAKSYDPKAGELIQQALIAIDSEIAWRVAADGALFDQINNFESFARTNLGLREQDRLNPEQVDYVTPCLAKHRDLSLQF